ncbi:MAG: ABC transporter ATP-binding protein [bacterium]
MSLIAFKQVNKKYQLGSQMLHVLKDINLVVDTGDFLAIMGPSGSGKSTLLNIIGCLDVPSSGSYIFDGQEVSSLSSSQLAQIRLRSVGFIFQNFDLLPRQTALKNVELPLIYSGLKPREQRAISVLKKVGLEDRINHRPKQLSGGEMQRVAIARALVNEPKIILADEPTGNLDSRSGVEIMMIFKQLNKQGKTVIVVTHDMEVAKFANKRINLKDGIIIND